MPPLLKLGVGVCALGLVVVACGVEVGDDVATPVTATSTTPGVGSTREGDAVEAITVTAIAPDGVWEAVAYLDGSYSLTGVRNNGEVLSVVYQAETGESVMVVQSPNESTAVVKRIVFLQPHGQTPRMRFSSQSF